MNIVNSFSALTAPHQFIFLPNSSNTDKLALVAKLGKTSLAKGIARSNKSFLLNLPDILPNVLTKSSPD